MSIERYSIDYEAVDRRAYDDLAIISILTYLNEKIADPAWSRIPLCYWCRTWKPEMGIETIPRRKGAVDPVEDCKGCWLALLDVREDVQTSFGGKPDPPPAPKPSTRPNCNRCSGPCEPKMAYLGPKQVSWFRGTLAVETVEPDAKEEEECRPSTLSAA